MKDNQTLHLDTN